MERIDLHTHTLASDGSDTPAAVVQQAAALGLRAVAVTDHDTFAGLPEALAAGSAAASRSCPAWSCPPSGAARRCTCSATSWTRAMPRCARS